MNTHKSRSIFLPLFLSVFMAIGSQSAAAESSTPLVLKDPINSNADYEWFVNDRFGMFIHFGLYSNAARHEWVMNTEKISPEDYKKYFDTFNPDLFDARAWAKAAKNAGMKYVVLTVKHHEGFALFDSALTDYKITNTPFKRDLVREYVDALRAEGLKVGFYYSLLDWHHPDFPVDGKHPMRDDVAYREKNAGRDITKYAAYLHGQVRELLTNYGKIDYMWFDFSYPQDDWGWSKGKGRKDWQSEELLKLVHQLQPKIIVNNRLDLTGGVQTPEQFQLKSTGPATELKLIEEAHTFSGSWGYDRDNMAWKSSEGVVRLLSDAVSKGHNLLLNVGPTGRGEFEPRAMERLAALAEWTKHNGRAIYGAGPSSFVAPPGHAYTQRGDRLYLHLSSYPIDEIELPGLAGKIKYAQFLHDGSEIRYREPKQKTLNSHLSNVVGENAVQLTLPALKPNVLNPVIEIFLKAP